MFPCFFFVLTLEYNMSLSKTLKKLESITLEEKLEKNKHINVTNELSESIQPTITKNEKESW